METLHVGHRDALHVLLLDAHVGASDGDGDTAVQGAEARDDLLEGGRDYFAICKLLFKKKLLVTISSAFAEPDTFGTKCCRAGQFKGQTSAGGRCS